MFVKLHSGSRFESRDVMLYSALDGRAESRVPAVRPDRVAVVLHHDRESAVVRPESGSDVPAEVPGRERVSLGAELEEVAARVVVAGARAEEDRAVRQHDGRGRPLVADSPGGPAIGRRIDAQRRAGAAPARSPLGGSSTSHPSSSTSRNEALQAGVRSGRTATRYPYRSLECARLTV